jgi:nucleoside-diphosphate-sugar epimerase
MNSTAGPRPILITGASGFIGAHLARALAASGHAVVGTCTSTHRAQRLRGMPPNFSLAVADVCNPSSLESLFATHRFGAVFHLAAQGVCADGGDPNSVTAVNTLGSLTVARTALRYGVNRFIYCGSGLEYGASPDPVNESAPLSAPNLYGASKAAASLLLDYLRRAEGLPLTTIRPFTVFGPAETETKLIPYVIARAQRHEPVQLTAGTQIRDYIYVSDVVDAMLLAFAADLAPGSVFNIGSGPREARTIREVVETILNLMGAPQSLCRYGEARRARPDPPCLVSDSSRASIQLGWRPRVSLEKGLARTIQSMASSSPNISASAAAA